MEEGVSMERLTRKDAYGYVHHPWEFNGVNGSYDIFDEDLLAKQIDRLAAYEDTGLEPEEVGALQKDWSNLCTIIGECGGLDRVKELAEADKDGHVVVLPCKVGDTVYTTHWWKYVKEKCTDSKGNSFYRTVHKNIIKKERFNPFGPDYEWIGKTVFLTREEAEAALKGGEG